MELEVSATTPLEMSQAQDSLIAWCVRKVASMKHEADELAENLAIAIKNKWKTDTLRRHSALAVKRVTFYEKIKAALEAGYCIVPNFPVTMFAIRTDKKQPLRYWESNKTQHRPWTGDKTQEAGTLAIGEGDYKNPTPEIETHIIETKKLDNGNEQKTFTSEAVGWNEIDFPINMAKPKIMEATSRAMALKVFDEMGILPDPHPKKDPMIVGRILDPRPLGYGQRKFITFIVAWHLNVRDL